MAGATAGAVTGTVGVVAATVDVVAVAGKFCTTCGGVSAVALMRGVSMFQVGSTSGAKAMITSASRPTWATHDRSAAERDFMTPPVRPRDGPRFYCQRCFRQEAVEQDRVPGDPFRWFDCQQCHHSWFMPSSRPPPPDRKPST